jgi:2'-5' RNA ligase
MARSPAMADPLFTIACLDIPDAQRRFIDDFRRVHDPQAALVPPHFTLVFGAVDVDEAACLRHVESVARATAPIHFHCRCAMLGADEHAERAFVYLVPDEGHAAIALLHDRLYGGPLAPGLRWQVPYTPHVTIGSCTDFQQAKAWCDGLNEQGVDVAGTLSALTVGALRAGSFQVLRRFEMLDHERRGHAARDLPPPGRCGEADAAALGLEIGNAAALDTQRTGWWIGFSDWTRDGGPNLRHMPAGMAASGLSAKWYDHPSGHPNGESKPVSEGRSVSLLVGEQGEFRLDFSRDPTFPPDRTLTRVMRRRGDFVAWGAGLHHRAFGLRDSSILTLRWVPQDDARTAAAGEP